MAKSNWEKPTVGYVWTWRGSKPANAHITLESYDGVKYRGVIYWGGKTFKTKRLASLATAKRNTVKMLVFLERQAEAAQS